MTLDAQEEHNGNHEKTLLAIKDEFKVTMSETTFLETCHRAKLRFNKPKKVPYLTETHKMKRVAFAQDNADRDWDHVVFSDEALFRCESEPPGRWYRIGARPQVNKTGQGPRAMVFWAISKTHRFSPQFVVDNVDAVTYKKILSNAFRGRNLSGMVFQQDNAPAHKAKSTKQYLQSKNVTLLPNWPANSPDLNCIENAWAILKRRVYAHKTTTKAGLIDAIKSEIAAFTQEEVCALVDSTPRRLTAVITKNGGHIPY